MSEEWPKIRSRRTMTISPWVGIIAREVEFTRGAELETYHAVVQADYVGIVARTPDGRILVVRQYRPARETYTWELPAGTVDKGEDPAESARRELLEETGYPARSVHPLGITSPCTGRMSNFHHCFFIEAGDRITDARPEPGIEVDLITLKRLLEMIRYGGFIAQLHIGAVFQAGLLGFLELAPLLNEYRTDVRRAPSHFQL
jgi:8-oxo-dGTP pyrophosphatase MutT (NUDIX family)